MSITMDMPIFRRDINVVKKTGAGNTSRYLIKTPSDGELYEFGVEEYFLYTQLNGRNTVEEILARFKHRFNLNLSEENLIAFIRQMGNEGLLDDYIQPETTWLSSFEFRGPDKWKHWKIFNPAPLTAWLAVHLRWVFTRTFVVASALFFLLAVFTIFKAPYPFYMDLALFFEPLSLLQIMAISYCFLNIPCEIMRGMTSAHFGSRPTEFGIWFAYDVLPRFYCRSRILELNSWRKRSWTLFASSYFSLIVFTVSTLIWRMTPRNTLLHEFVLIMMVTAMIDAFAKLNVLWPTEGYYLLSNYLGIIDLRRRSMRALKCWILRRPQSEPLTSREKTIFRIYGLLMSTATLSMLGVIAYLLGSMLVTAMAGTGALLFVAIFAVKYRHSIYQLRQQPAKVRPLPGVAGEPPVRKKKKIWPKIVLLVVIVGIMAIPYPYEAGGPFRFMPAKTVNIHTQVSGEIKSVFVKEGDLVKKGQVLAYLDTREHKRNYDVTKADLDRATSVLKKLEAGAKPEEVKKAEQEIESAKTSYGFSNREAERAKSLFEAGVVAQEEYEKAAKVAAIDSDNVDAAKASLELVNSGARKEEIEAQKAIIRDLKTKLTFYKENLSLTRIVSPIKGVVATPYIDQKVGDILRENDLFAVINDIDKIHAEVQISESDIDEIHIGNIVKVRVWSQPTKLYYGKVVSIAPQADNTADGNVVRVLTEIPNPSDSLKPDMTGEAKISGGTKPVIVAFTRMFVRFFMVEVWSWIP